VLGCSGARVLRCSGAQGAQGAQGARCQL